MFQRLPTLLTAVALACSVGLHWAVLQSFAWSTMLASNLTRTSLTTALERTFDGKHPCALCKMVAEGRKSEKKSSSEFSHKKIEGIVRPAALTVCQPACFTLAIGPAIHPTTVLYRPPVPPPRSA